jgi:hypothetical protein
MVQISKKLQFLQETALFGLLHRIDRGLRAQKPFGEFKQYLAEQYEGVDANAELPEDKTLRDLYERAIDARTDRAWVKATRGTAKAKRFKDHLKWLKQTVSIADELISVLKSGDRLLLKRDARQVKLTARRVERLRHRLHEIHRWGMRFNEVAKTRNWNSALRQARDGMDRTLQKHCPNLNGAQRSEIVLLAVEAAGLKKEDTMDAILRQQNRVRRKKRDARPHRRR